MRLRKKKWAKPELEKDPKVIFTPTEFKGKWKDLFGNDHPIHVELGCGRGKFIAQLAARNKNINYIAIDTHPELLVYVLRKLNENGLDNVRLIPMHIEDIESAFGKDEVDKIYINFCNPWVNKRHHKRRLTHINFLRIYQNFLKEGAEIWFKTDDDLLFADSLNYFKETGFVELYSTHDLYQKGTEEEIMTEYEEKFINEGIKIKFARFKNTLISVF